MYIIAVERKDVLNKWRLEKAKDKKHREEQSSTLSMA
jgi:hypothetical protein